jgi:hypothetical protein
VRTTGPILAIGGITLGNAVLLHGKPIDYRIPIATGIAAGAFALAEKAYEPLAVGLAWVALVAVLFVRMTPDVPSPIESLNSWWTHQGKA